MTKKISFLIKSILIGSIISITTSLIPFNVQASTLAAKTTNNPTEILSDMGIGWNLGNSLDSHDSGTLSFDTSDPKAWETSWGNTITTKAIIDKIKESGFNTIRIPVTWGIHMGSAPDYTVNDSWMKRVQEIVDYCMDNNIYAIIDVHHDNSWCIPNYENETASIDKLTKLWTQIAVHFKDYDYNLLFEVLNEPREVGSPTEWTGGTKESRDVVNKLNQAALNAIRLTGGNNSQRTVILPTYAASATIDAIDDFKVPNDKHIMVSLHAYSPSLFAQTTEDSIPSLKKNLEGILPQEYIDMIDWHSLLTKWGSDEDKKNLTNEFDIYHNKFIAKGIPVLLGEFGAWNKNNSDQRANYSGFYVSEAKKRGMACILWDNGNSSEMGYFDRKNLTWFFPEIRNSIINSYNNTPTLK